MKAKGSFQATGILSASIVNFLSFHTPKALQGLCQLFSSTCRTVYLVYAVVRSYGALAASFS